MKWQYAIITRKIKWIIMNETHRGLLSAEQLLCIEPSETPTWKSLTKRLTFYK